MPEPVKRDPEAPQLLELIVKDNMGNEWGKLSVPAKEFSTGSVGFYVSEKIANPKNGERYQCSLSFTLIGSKPKA
ncbi:MAG: hypothetical protein LBB43_07775 [Spirochaetaceae bacterium]|jgi:hypothetical protein|nr:hypothetical protein [Spirochaetaceae bacterium]